jgi:hypothetical protein
MKKKPRAKSRATVFKDKSDLVGKSLGKGGGLPPSISTVYTLSKKMKSMELLGNFHLGEPTDFCLSKENNFFTQQQFISL